MKLREFFGAVSHSPSVGWPSFRIPADHIVDETGYPPETDHFAAGRTYLEVRLLQLHLQNQRDYWQGYRPVGSFAVELLYNGERQSVPFVVGPDLLSQVPHVNTGDNIEYTNIRVAGPYPYSGDDVGLFAGLYRLESRNWAKGALSLLETVGRVFDPTLLSTFISISGPLVDGVQKFLGMQEVEARLANLRQLSQPPDDLPENRVVPATVLHPAYEVWLRVPDQQFGDQQRQRFWVKEGRLWEGDGRQQLTPYRDADFLLLRTVALTRRSDYERFSFHKQWWPKVVASIWNGHPDEAENSFHLLASSLAESQDIIYPHRHALLKNYRTRMGEERDQYEQAFADGSSHFTSGAPKPIDDAELTAVVDAADPAVTDGTPESLLAAVGL